MKNFWTVLSGVLVLVFTICLSSNKLSNIFEKELTGNFQSAETVIALGDLGFVVEKQENARCISYLKDNKVIGECICLEGGPDRLNTICSKLGLTILKKYNIGERLMIEGSSALLDYSLDGTNQNVQICYNQGKIILGSPIIYGNY